MHSRAKVERPLGPAHPFTIALCRELGAEGANISDRAIAKFCTGPACEVTEDTVKRWKLGLERPKGRSLAKLRGLFTRLKTVTISDDSTPPLTTKELAEAREKAEKKDETRLADQRAWEREKRPPRRFGPALEFYRVQAKFIAQDVVYWLNGRLPTYEVNWAKYAAWERGSEPIPPSVAVLVLDLFDDLREAVEQGLVERPPGLVDNMEEPEHTMATSSRFNSPRLVTSAPRKVKVVSPPAVKPAEPVDIVPPASARPVPMSSPAPVIAVVPAPAPTPVITLEDLAMRYAVAIREEKAAVAARKAAELLVAEAQAALEAATRHADAASEKRAAAHKALEDA